MRTCLFCVVAVWACESGLAQQKERPLATVAQWGRFETAVINTKSYGDPYRDVTLDVVYTRPDGAVLKFWGFYDGSQDGPSIWKIRCLPDQPGRWKYKARFSDGAPGLAGEFECIASDLPGVISPYDGNPMWFGFRGGEPVLIRGLHIGDRYFASNWPDEERRRFLDWAAKQGYNTLSIASHFLKRDTPDRGGPWNVPKLWPLDAGEYRKLERLLDELASRRFIVFPFAGFFGQKSNYPRQPEDQELYIRYTLARLGCYGNLLFNTAGPEPNLGKSWMPDAEVQRLGRSIARHDPFRHLISVHNRTGDDPYRDSDWTTYGVLQGPKTVDLNRLSSVLLRNHHPQKPLLAQETLWSGNINHPRYTDEQLFRNAWVIHMSAAALVFADNGNGNSSAGFSGSLNPADAAQKRHDIVKRVWDLAQQFPFARLQPRQDLVDGGYCLADEGTRYLVYLPAAPSAVNVRVERGPYAVQWINARDDQQRHQGEPTSDGSQLRPPGEGDWLLWLVRAKD